MRCYYCMKELKNNAELCTGCGKPPLEQNPSHQLAAGSVLNGKYLIGKSTGESRLGITYVGFDKSQGKKITVKEYFPSEIAKRSNADSNEVLIGDTNSAGIYQQGRDKFISEAESIAKSSDDCDFFTANNTAYIVMNYPGGEKAKNRFQGQCFAQIDPADETAKILPTDNWQPVSSAKSKSLTKIVSTKKMMIATALVACCAVAAIFIFAGIRNSESNDEPVTVAAITVPDTTPQSATTDTQPTSASTAASSSVNSETTEITKSKKPLLDFVNSLELAIDGSQPESHIKDEKLVLEYYFLGSYILDDEEGVTMDPEESLKFNGYKERLASVFNYLETQIKNNGYSISNIIVEGYDHMGTQFFHIQSSE